MSHPTSNPEFQPSPFIAFCRAKRSEVKAANPNAEFGQMGRLLRYHWNQLNESEKASYALPRKGHQSNRPVNIPFSSTPQNDTELRRSSRLKNKRLGVNFWGIKQ
jgi:hypothetical protein